MKSSSEATGSSDSSPKVTRGTRRRPSISSVTANSSALFGYAPSSSVRDRASKNSTLSSKVTVTRNAASTPPTRAPQPSKPGVAAAAALFAFFRFTLTGKAIRACADNYHGALVVGLNVRRLYALTFGLGAACAAIDDPLARRIDAGGAARHEPHADRIEQRPERGYGAGNVGLVEARTHAQLGLWGKHGDVHIQAFVLVQQADRAQGTPHAGEAGTDDQDLLFHVVISRSE